MTAIIGVLVLLGVAIAIFAWCANVLQGEDAEFTATTIEFFPVDGANLTVLLEVANAGPEFGTADCDIQAHDASGRIVGFDLFEMDLEPGDSQRGRATIRIEDLGAARVVNVTADCN